MVAGIYAYVRVHESASRHSCDGRKAPHGVTAAASRARYPMFEAADAARSRSLFTQGPTRAGSAVRPRFGSVSVPGRNAEA